MKRMIIAGLSAALALAIATAAPAADKKTLAFVVNGASDFWKLAEAGVKKAQGELPNYDLQFKYPEQAAAAVQQRLMDDLVAAGADAIMVSAVDPKTPTDALNRSPRRCRCSPPTATRPQSNRIAYIGSSNTDAGKQAGELMLKALPERRQVHGLRRPARRRQCARAHRGRARRRSRARRSSWSTCAATTSTRPAPSAMSRTCWPPIPTSTAWSASTPTTRRGSTRC